MPEWRNAGQEPDYRFTLANERTFLAWIRMGLGLSAFGLLLVQLASLWTVPDLAVAIGALVSAFAAVIAVVAYLRWRRNEIAMRHAAPLPAGLLLPVTACVAAVAALALAALALHG